MTSGDVPMIFTNHLGGTEDDKWVMEYDTAGREEESGALARVDASGEDIICIAGWLYFKSPAPQVPDGMELDMFIATYVWKKKA